MAHQAEEVERLSDGRAKAVAGYWFDERAPDTSLSLLFRDGRITGGLVTALHRDLRVLEVAAGGASSAAQQQLRELMTYAGDNGPRGPLAGWEDLAPVHLPPPEAPAPPREPQREPLRRLELPTRHEVARRQETPPPPRPGREPVRKADLTVDLSAFSRTPPQPSPWPGGGSSALDLDP